jgi:hypothetical protein
VKPSQAVVIIALVLAGCSREREAAIALRVTFEPGVQSTHVVVRAAGGSVVKATPCVKVEPAGLDIGIAQGDLPQAVTLSAEGFSDSDCAVPTDPTENAVPVERRFRAGLIIDALLHVRPTQPRIETNCANGLDDDGDGLRDCLDDDCIDRACTTGNACVEGQRCQNRACVGGQQVTCTSPPSACLSDAGACITTTGCTYLPAPGVACDDEDECTVMDHCNDQGTCVGQPRQCTSPPAGQCWRPVGTCVTGVGCTYHPDVNAGCDDRDNCTVDDRCDADAGCAGTRVTCTAPACQHFTGACEADGGCRFAAIDAGTPCPGGTCNASGGCIPDFPFVPSNVALTDVPTPPTTKVTLDCGTTTIDTGSSGAPVVTNWCSGQPMFGAASVTQPGGVPAVILAFSELEIVGGSTLALVGARPAIIVATGDLTVLGTLTTAAGAQACVGSGAGGAGVNGIANDSGGGGGGFGSAGGAGGRVTNGNLGGPGGAVNGVDTLSPLRGGCPGGRGAANSERLANGGGAVQLIARGTLTIAGIVNAPGEGGRGGGPFTGGNGGGSGGGVLLEAARVVMSAGGVMANGGGGGEGGTGNDGQSGRPALMAAAGGADLFPGGEGGAGAFGTTAAEMGREAVGVGGGGGGGVGRIRINVSELCNIGPPSTVVLTPPPTSNRPDAGCP